MLSKGRICFLRMLPHLHHFYWWRAGQFNCCSTKITTELGPLFSRMVGFLLPNAHLPHSKSPHAGPWLWWRRTRVLEFHGGQRGLFLCRTSPYLVGSDSPPEGMGLSPVGAHAWARGRGDALPAGRLCPPRGHLFRARGGNSRPHWPRWKAPRGSYANGPGP